MVQVTVVGGGIGGLVAAVAAREQGHEVTLHEAHERLGGRGWTTGGERHANWGPHVMYTDTGLWGWLHERKLTQPFDTLPKAPKMLIRADGRGRRVPPVRAGRNLLRLRKMEAPVDRSFTDWATEVVGDEESVARVAAFSGVNTFHHDPGSLSAAYIVERLRQAAAFPPTVRYLRGGWAPLFDRLADRARSLGVRIETSSRVEALPDGGPAILAVPLPAASTLLGETVTWTGARTALLDVAMTKRRGDAFIVSDWDAPGWAETFSMPDKTLAPKAEHLVQVQVGMGPDESHNHTIARAEELLDVGYPGWRQRETWRRQAKIEDETGAVDHPGTSWRDRPAIDRGDDVYLVGDMTSSPGILSEVSYASTMTAVDAITRKAMTTALRPRAAKSTTG